MKLTYTLALAASALMMNTFSISASGGTRGTLRNNQKGYLPTQKKLSACSPEMCLSRPTSMTFVYTGGNCNQSYHAQENNHFFCLDHSPEGAPAELGALSYIKVYYTTPNGRSRVYHSDWVRVGETFTLFDNGEELDDSLIMTIHQGEGKEKKKVQEIIFHATCDGNMFLCDRLGAVQICGIINDDQGEILSCPSGLQLGF